jgi:transposase
MRYVFLPPYSPDYSPIELAFSAIKYHIRRQGETGRDAIAADGRNDDLRIRLFLLAAVFSVTAQDAVGWFSACGYM